MESYPDWNQKTQFSDLSWWFHPFGFQREWTTSLNIHTSWTVCWLQEQIFHIVVIDFAEDPKSEDQKSATEISKAQLQSLIATGAATVAVLTTSSIGRSDAQQVSTFNLRAQCPSSGSILCCLQPVGQHMVADRAALVYSLVRKCMFVDRLYGVCLLILTEPPLLEHV